MRLWVKKAEQLHQKAEMLFQGDRIANDAYTKIVEDHTKFKKQMQIRIFATLGIIAIAYHVAINGQATGPFDMATLQQMAANGQLTASCLVWKSGMAQWVAAGSVAELNGLFTPAPPVPQN